MGCSWQFAPHVPKGDPVHPFQSGPDPALVRDRRTQPGKLFLTQGHRKKGSPIRGSGQERCFP